jgi:hypothetical protein
MVPEMNVPANPRNGGKTRQVNGSKRDQVDQQDPRKISDGSFERKIEH